MVCVDTQIIIPLHPKTITNSVFSKTMIRKIEYFHPSGRTTLPDGICYYKGFFIKTCLENEAAFAVPEDCCGVIVFPVGIEPVSREDYRVGHYFHGSFIADEKILFNADSSAIAIVGISSYKLKRLAKRLAKEMQTVLLVKTKDEIYITH